MRSDNKGTTPHQEIDLQSGIVLVHSLSMALHCRDFNFHPRSIGRIGICFTSIVQGMSCSYGDAHGVCIMNINLARPAIFWNFRYGRRCEIRHSVAIRTLKEARGLSIMRFGITVSGHVSQLFSHCQQSLERFCRLQYCKRLLSS